ncbi:hypothetical protein [Vibrio hepatarius]|uniref:hypothetical protein n=1 Tax=Vibrio hepatarius TaxID=171383 RepID=UPI001C09B973|nr:hypothetical protein [Vibrio hepatarius]MBU2895992.1 hypothetical protein [Vibrio hepatarius]
MTNSNKTFMPKFPANDSVKERVFKRLSDSELENKKDDIFYDINLPSDFDGIPTLIDRGNSDFTDFVSEEFPSIKTDPRAKDPIFSDDEFDKILSEVDSMSVPSGLKVLNESVGMDDEDDEDLDPDIDEEIREAIFAEGYMQGSVDQKEVMEKRFVELQKTISDLKIATTHPAALSEEINQAIGSFIKSVAESVLDELKSSYLADIVESRVKDFVSGIKEWELATYAYCSRSDFMNLTEIFGIEEVADFTRGGVHYSIESDLPDGRFRLEVQKEDGSNVEAIMDVDSHLSEVKSALSEAF